MKLRPATGRFLMAEILLPLLLFSGKEIISAVILLPFAAGLTLALLELLRPRFNNTGLVVFYFFWLVICGGGSWAFAGLPPYWILSLYLLIPRSAWDPSFSQKKRPAFFGFKKYFKPRMHELVQALFFGSLFAAAAVILRPVFSGLFIWVLVIFMAAFIETLAVQRRKA